jgi:hypothetical protein
MKTYGIAVGVAVLLVASVASAQSQLDVFASVVDGAGAPVATVQPADLRVLEDGAALKVVKIEAVNGWPTKLQVLLDNGIGMGSENLIHLRNGLRNLLGALPAGVEVTVVTTAPQPRMLLRPTTDRDAYLKAPDLLAPDTGSGKFVDAMKEALQRVEKDKSNHFPMIVALATAAGDGNFMERDVKQIQQRVLARPITVHAAVISLPGRTGSQGAIQGELGIWTTKVTGGRFETIAAVSRAATLLEEYGVAVAESHVKQSRQFRITAERANASAPVGGISASASGGLTLTGLSFDGRHP